MQLTIKTDHKWRETLYRYDLPDRVLVTEFDYQNAEEVGDGYFQYRGRWYHMDQFMVVTPNSPLRGWDGYHSDSSPWQPQLGPMTENTSR